MSLLVDKLGNTNSYRKDNWQIKLDLRAIATGNIPLRGQKISFAQSLIIPWAKLLLNQPPIQYLNTDLELQAAQDISLLIQALEQQGLFVLNMDMTMQEKTGATFETIESFISPSANIIAMLDIIEGLSPHIRKVWNACECKEFDMGFESGNEKGVYRQSIHPDVLSRIAAIGATLKLTIYPPLPKVNSPSSFSPEPMS